MQLTFDINTDTGKEIDIKGKVLKGKFEEEEDQQMDLFRVGFPEFGYYGDLNMENQVNVSETSSFTRVPSFPEPIVLPPPPPPGLNPSTTLFLFKKELKLSDVGHARRIIIPKAHAENYFPSLANGDGIFIYMEDMDAPHVWVFRFRYWQNNNSRMYVLEKAGDFVKAHVLKAGDSVLFYKDAQTERYGIQAKKNRAEAITPMNGINVPMGNYWNLVPRNDIGTYIYPESYRQNQMVNFLDGPEVTTPNVESSMSSDPANMYPYPYFWP